jgi:hypothetical protein
MKTNKQIQNPIYSAIFVDENQLKQKYPPKLKNEYYHHSTIEFKPTEISNIEIGKETNLKIIGRLTTNKVDVLLVENALSKNKYPHITLSTSDGIKPFESNSEIVANLDKITPLNDNIKGIFGIFDGKQVYKEKEIEYTIGGL